MATIVALCPYCRRGGVRAPERIIGSVATCPKCGTDGFYPKLLAQWHAAGDAFDGRMCPVDEHLHALCPTCNYALYFHPADHIGVAAHALGVN